MGLLKELLWSNTTGSILLRWGLLLAVVGYGLGSLKIVDNAPPGFVERSRVVGQGKYLALVALSICLEKETENSTRAGYPADIGATTNLEYLAYLIKKGGIKDSEVTRFCKPGVHIKSFKELKAEHLQIKFANVSAADSPQTVFAASKNYSPEATRSDSGKGTQPLPANEVVILKDGTSRRYPSLQPNEGGAVPLLPPREPKFLGD